MKDGNAITASSHEGRIKVFDEIIDMRIDKKETSVNLEELLKKLSEVNEGVEKLYAKYCYQESVGGNNDLPKM